jgi:hypothetical protein
VNEGENKAPTLQIRSRYFIAALVLDDDRERVVRADRELDFGGLDDGEGNVSCSRRELGMEGD